MGYWSDLLFGPNDEDDPVPVKTLTCPVCKTPSEKRHCEAVGCTWFLCVPCGLVLAPGKTRRWNGPPKDRR